MDQALMTLVAGFRQRLIADQAIVTAGQARMVDTIAACAEAGAFSADGATDLTSWVMATLNIPYPQASDLVGLARRLRELPELAKSFAQGDIPIEAAGAAAKLATPETDAFFTEVAESTPAKDLLRAVKHQEALAAQNEPAPRRATFDWKFDAEGWTRFSGWLPPEQGAEIIAAVTRAGNADDHPDAVTGEWDRAETKAARGLVALASTTLERDADPDRATVVVHVDVRALVCGEGAATLCAGGVIPARVAQRLACDGRTEIVAEDHGRVVDIAPAKRTIPASLLRQLHHRDECCVFPGCGRSRQLHAHHIIHWAHNGPTELTNLALLCTAHHALMHEGGWNAVGDPEPGPGGRSTLRFFRPDGTVYEPNPAMLVRLAQVRPPAAGQPPEVMRPPKVVRPTRDEGPPAHAGWAESLF